MPQKDIDGEYNAIRARLQQLGTSGGSGSRGSVRPHTHSTVAPHSHHASEIQSDEVGNVAATNAQSAIGELDVENLARDGTQPMLGNLDMNSFQIFNILNLLMSGGVGNALLNQVRKIAMAGDFATDGEAHISGVERLTFNNEVTESLIDVLSRIHFNTAVAPDTHYDGAEGRVSWSSLEKTLIVHVASGPGS